MKVFIAGATGAIGRPLVTQLIRAGHVVTGLARDEKSAKQLQDQGATAAIANALEARAVHDAVARSAPDVVINQLTALPQRFTPETMQAAIEPDQRLRHQGGA